MKKILSLLIIILMIAGCAGPREKRTEFNINGSINKDMMAWVYLKKREEGAWITLDSVIIKEKLFSFTGKVDFPDRYYIQIPQSKSLVPFFIESSDIAIAIDVDTIDNTTISGSISNDEFEAYLDELLAYENRINGLVSRYKQARDEDNTILMEELDPEIDKVYGEKESFIKQFVLENNFSAISPYVAYRNVYQFDLKDLETITDTLDESIYPSIYYQFLKTRVFILKRVDVGKPFIPFEMADTSGVMLSLADISKGNYLLVDFWAAWCEPCRKENPNLVSAYYKYQNKGLEILSVSLDNNKSDWVRAIHEDNMTWIHLSDLKGWSNSAAKLYGIMSIPSNIFLDPEGIIIAKNLRGKRLNTKLVELFGE